MFTVCTGVQYLLWSRCLLQRGDRGGGASAFLAGNIIFAATQRLLRQLPLGLLRLLPAVRWTRPSVDCVAIYSRYTLVQSTARSQFALTCYC